MPHFLLVLQDQPSIFENISDYLIFIIIGAYFGLKFLRKWFILTYDRPLYRHILVYKTVSKAQESILEKEFSFYNKLSEKHKKQFRHRVSAFIDDKEFVGREGVMVTLEMQTIIAATACMLSFGRKKYLYHLIKTIIIYPAEFYSANNDAYHKGEFNPKLKVLVLSWKDFKEGYEIDNDNFNLGLHEFMHAMHLGTRANKNADSIRFKKHFKLIMKRLENEELRKTLDDTKFFRAYAFTNKFEFMAVLTEYFFESPEELKTLFPVLYNHVNKALNMQVAGF